MPNRSWFNGYKKNDDRRELNEISHRRRKKDGHTKKPEKKNVQQKQETRIVRTQKSERTAYSL